MKNHEHGILTTTTDKLLVDFVTEVTKRVSSDYLKKEHPDIYQEALKASKSRKVKVTIQPVRRWAAQGVLMCRAALRLYKKRERPSLRSKICLWDRGIL